MYRQERDSWLPRAGEEDWAPKNGCFWIVVLEKSSKQSILKEIYPVYSLEGLLQKLKLQYFGHQMWRANSLEKILMLGKTEDRRRRGRQRMRWLDSITNSVDMNLRKLWEIVLGSRTWCTTGHGVAKSQTRLSNWTTRAGDRGGEGDEVVFRAYNLFIQKLSQNLKK